MGIEKHPVEHGDTVEVVRCIDCIYYTRQSNNPCRNLDGTTFCYGWCDCIEKHHMLTQDDNYCMFGERGIKPTTNATDKQIIKNYLDMHRRRGRTNWEIVRDLLLTGTSHAGRTSACRKCLEIGIDPDGHDLAPCKDAEKRREKLEGI